MRRSTVCRLCALVCVLALLLSGCKVVKKLTGRMNTESENENLPRNRTDPEAFRTLENGAVDYPGAVQGIDVSSHQREIDWQKVRADGISFAIIQIGFRGYGDGSLNEDVRFAYNYEQARAAGIAVGAYFYSQALTEAEAEEEADFVLKTLNGRSLQLPVFYDWEDVSTGRTAGAGGFQVSDFALRFCRTVVGAGYNAGVYFNRRDAYLRLRLGDLKAFAFWLAEYDEAQSFRYAVHFWQYTGKGKVDGIELPVDRDLMYTDSESLTEGAP